MDNLFTYVCAAGFLLPHFFLFSNLGDGWLPFLGANITKLNRERRRLRRRLKRTNCAGVKSVVSIDFVSVIFFLLSSRLLRYINLSL